MYSAASNAPARGASTWRRPQGERRVIAELACVRSIRTLTSTRTPAETGVSYRRACAVCCLHGALRSMLARKRSPQPLTTSPRSMDEYVGIPREHPESYHSYMWNNFFKFIDIKCVCRSKEMAQLLARCVCSYCVQLRAAFSALRVGADACVVAACMLCAHLRTCCAHVSRALHA